MADEEAPPEEAEAPPEEAAVEPVEEPPAEPPVEPEVTIEEPPPVEPAPIPETPPINPDALSMEFLYYGSVLKVVAPTLSNNSDRERANPWIKKLFRPEYQTSKLRDKRNRYMVALTVNLLNDEVSGAFNTKPPEAAIPEITTIVPEPSPAAEWELDKMWQETLLAFPDNYEVMKCTVHSDPEDCKNDHKLDKILDQEFQFMLYMARPYAALLSPGIERDSGASWLQLLCSIQGNNCCSSLKAIRNDYLMALLGYLNDLRLPAPFLGTLPAKLIPLREFAESAKDNPVTDPTSPEVSQFLVDQPIPEDGAFCYVALTGDLVASSL